MMALIHSMRARGQWSDTREADLLDGGAPFYRTYECADGKFLAVGPLEPQFFAQLVAIAGLPESHKISQMSMADWPERRTAYAEFSFKRNVMIGRQSLRVRTRALRLC